MCNFAWIKINGFSYMCKIIHIDLLNKRCICEIGETRFTDVPFSELQAPYGEKLPWEN